MPLIATVLASLSTFLQSWGTYDNFTDSVSLFFDNGGETFDFIIGRSPTHFSYQVRIS
jgi:hypothetical protein